MRERASLAPEVPKNAEVSCAALAKGGEKYPDSKPSTFHVGQLRAWILGGMHSKVPAESRTGGRGGGTKKPDISENDLGTETGEATVSI